MDHLDRPTHPSRDQYKIPYVCLAPYDEGDFLSYPSRCGFDDASVLEGHFILKSPDGEDEAVDLGRVQSFLQSWLFFGLIFEVHRTVGRAFSPNDYVSRDSLLTTASGQRRGLTRRVNTSALSELLSFWVDSFKAKRSAGELSFEDVRQLCFKIDTYLQPAYKICYHLVQGRHSYIDQDLLLSFMCLGNTVDDAMAVVFHRCFYDFLPPHQQNAQLSPSGWVPLKRRWDAPLRILQTLVHSGWCPFDVGILERDFGINEIIYASQLRRHGSVERHSSCTPTACIANNIDDLTYVTRHETLGNKCPGSSCRDIEFDYLTLCEIIRGGSKPIVRSEIDTHGELHFRIVPYGGDVTPYVAISHVWSHGLGNTKKNTLPRCQLEALHRRASALLAAITSYNGPDPTQDIKTKRVSYFWLDTICVPVKPEDVDIRKMAISSMASIYEEAHSVLVLDEGLMNTSLHPSEDAVKIRALNRQSKPPFSPKQLVFSLLFSDWWRRLWTLQEGVLPDYLFVAFADFSVFLSHAVPAGREEHVENRADLSSDRVKEGLSDLIDKSHIADDKGVIIVDRKTSKGDMHHRRRVLRLLCNRTTSRIGDEPICVATLMGLDLKILLDTKPPERMQMLYKCLGRIPAGLVFLPVPKLQIEHFRWAPRSLIGVSISLTTTQVLLSDEDGEAEVTELGVRLRASGYPLASLGVPLKNNFYIFPGTPGSIPSGQDEDRLTDIDKVRANDDQIIAVTLHNQQVMDRFGDAGISGHSFWETMNGQDLIDPVVILPSKRRIDYAQNPGILAGRARLIDDVWHAKFLCNVWTFRNSMAMWGDSSGTGGGTIANRVREERAALVQGERTGKMAWFQSSEVVREWRIS
ncbi:hypothetical protein B0A52_05173 [Exophiala mesophila]|uniref:Heterokaryon incompatibility domain-containing protein n=1 Tax=Exophiala mesophila TaxID=212818 RepID=A0A438N4A9_EXOME|nr:hypothetical protein B0A52_05173 [Exophiala mesophila]